MFSTFFSNSLSFLLSLVVVLFFNLRATAQKGDPPDWSAYPSASQPCLAKAFDAAACQTYTLTNPARVNCVCDGVSGTFFRDSAECIGANDPSDLTTVYNALIDYCSSYGITVAGTLSDFLSSGGVDTRTLISRTRTATQAAGTQGQGAVQATPKENVASAGGPVVTDSSPQSPAATGDHGGVGGLSSGMIALISCLAAVGSLIVAVAAFRYTKKKPEARLQGNS